MSDPTPRTAADWTDRERARFLAKTDRSDPDGCWPWLGYVRQNGYGGVRLRKRHHNAHRAGYMLFVGPIPDGFQVDHLCKNTRCVRPDHMEAVPPRVNNMRSNSPTARNARKSHCKRGHPLTPGNLINLSNGDRQCAACNRLRVKRCREARKVRVEQARARAYAMAWLASPEAEEALQRAWLDAMHPDHNAGCLDQAKAGMDCPVAAEVVEFVPRVLAALRGESDG